MKIIFFGSSEFAVPVLGSLKAKHEVVLIVTQPDRKKGRSSSPSPTAVKATANKLGIEVFQPADVNSRESIGYLEKFGADIFTVVSFGQILSKGLLGLPRVFPINLHASILPGYRGAAPINWAIANGEKETGVTIIRMNEKMDAGDIILKETVAIGKDEDAIMLSERLSKKGAGVLLRSLDLIEKDSVVFKKQDNAEASYAPKLEKKDGLIDWAQSAEEIHNRIRAFVPWPGCFTYWHHKIVKIYKAQFDLGPIVPDSRPGMVLNLSRENIAVATGRGILRILELQLESRRRMKVGTFIAGHKEMTAGAVFSLQK